MRAKIEKFLECFPQDAASWEQASEEIREMAHVARKLLEVYDGITVEPVKFRAIETPAEWNTAGHRFILTGFDRMAEATRELFYDYFREWFDSREE